MYWSIQTEAAEGVAGVDCSLNKKGEKTKAELSKVLQDAGYANAAEFYTELFVVREEK